MAYPAIEGHHMNTTNSHYTTELTTAVDSRSMSICPFSLPLSLQQPGRPCEAVCNQIKHRLGNWGFCIYPSLHPTVSNICVMWRTMCMLRKRQISVLLSACTCVYVFVCVRLLVQEAVSISALHLCDANRSCVGVNSLSCWCHLQD